MRLRSTLRFDVVVVLAALACIVATFNSLPHRARSAALSDADMSAVYGAQLGCADGCYLIPSNDCVQWNQCEFCTWTTGSDNTPAMCADTGRHYIQAARDVCAKPDATNNMFCQPGNQNFPCFRIYSCKEAFYGVMWRCNGDRTGCVRSIVTTDKCRHCSEDQVVGPWVNANNDFCAPCGL